MPESLLVRFDALVARRGLAKNRSEVIRDLVRDALIDEECSMPGEEVMGTLTIVFNHHTGDVRDKLDGIQHEFFEQMIEQIDDHIKLERRWAHNLAHQAEDAGFETAGEKLHAAMSALDDIRALLDDAKEALEDDAEKASGVTVKLV